MWKIGDPVILQSTFPEDDIKEEEYGIVVGMKFDKKCRLWDCYVMFFGNKWPLLDDFKKTEPYCLRYFETSLKRYTPPPA